MKMCSCCKTQQPLSAFTKRGDNNAFYRSHCRSCNNAKNSARAKKGRNRRTKMNPDEAKKRQLEAQRRYNKTDRRKIKQSAYNAKRRAAKLNATPKWLSAKDKAHIEAYYELAHTLTHAFGVQMDVDHIIPLQGKNVCGLHVPWNLQVMHHEANMEKGNRTNE